jgi:uncharacterized protein YjiS (DUF1127 family)
MAHAITQSAAPALRSPLVFFKNLWTMLCWLGENSSRARMIREISAMSDADLEAKGLTREDLVRRVFDGAFYI